MHDTPPPSTHVAAMRVSPPKRHASWDERLEQLRLSSDRGGQPDDSLRRWIGRQRRLRREGTLAPERAEALEDAGRQGKSGSDDAIILYDGMDDVLRASTSPAADTSSEYLVLLRCVFSPH